MRISGRAPRTDEAIHEDVVERLKKEDALSSSNIEVAVSRAEVTLRGLVDDSGGQVLAEQVAFDVRGVDDVVNQLSVKPEWGDEGAAMETEFGTEEATESSTSDRFDA